MEAPLADKDNMDLRNMIVDYLLAHADDYLLFVVKEYSIKTKPEKVLQLKLAYIKKSIEKLREPNTYNTEFGDIVPQVTPNAFNIRIIIHDWSWEEKRFRPADISPSGGAPLYTVNLLRINANHFDLLFPKADFDEDKRDKWEMIKLLRAGK